LSKKAVYYAVLAGAIAVLVLLAVAIIATINDTPPLPAVSPVR
jgi:hypothetical protein